MARKKASSKSNKSQAIRDYSASNRSAKPKAIAEALVADGYDVTPQYVSIILSNDRKKAGASPRRSAAVAKSPARAAKTRSAKINENLSIENLLQAKQLVEQAGSLREARAAIDAYAQLVG